MCTSYMLVTGIDGVVGGLFEGGGGGSDVGRKRIRMSKA